MSRPRRFAVLGVVGLAAGTVLWTGIASAALVDVRVGNFYFEDASVGDGQVVITAGDQIRFVVDDNGRGKQHTIDIDEFDVHSGLIAKGETFTTGPLTTPGTYALYCDIHRNRGHETTLVILPADGATTTTSTTSAAPSTTTSAAPSTTTPAEATTATTTTSVAPSITTIAPSSVTAPAGPADSDPTSGSDEVASGDVDSGVAGDQLAPTGRGTIDLDELDPLPPAEGSLEDLLGRAPGGDGPWTRAVWMSLVALVPLTVIGGLAALRFLHVWRRGTGIEPDPGGDA